MFLIVPVSEATNITVGQKRRAPCPFVWASRPACHCLGPWGTQEPLPRTPALQGQLQALTGCQCGLYSQAPGDSPLHGRALHCAVPVRRELCPGDRLGTGVSSASLSPACGLKPWLKRIGHLCCMVAGTPRVFLKNPQAVRPGTGTWGLDVGRYLPGTLKPLQPTLLAFTSTCVSKVVTHWWSKWGPDSPASQPSSLGWAKRSPVPDLGREGGRGLACRRGGPGVNF